MNRCIAISSLAAVGLSLAAAAAEADIQSLVAEADRAARGEVTVVAIPWSFPSNRVDWAADLHAWQTQLQDWTQKDGGAAGCP